MHRSNITIYLKYKHLQKKGLSSLYYWDKYGKTDSSRPDRTNLHLLKWFHSCAGHSQADFFQNHLQKIVYFWTISQCYLRTSFGSGADASPAPFILCSQDLLNCDLWTMYLKLSDPYPSTIPTGSNLGSSPHKSMFFMLAPSNSHNVSPNANSGWPEVEHFVKANF